MYVCLYMDMCMILGPHQNRGIGYPRSGITGSYEPSDIDTGKQTQILTRAVCNFSD